jgi:hypothetical protein
MVAPLIEHMFALEGKPVDHEVLASRRPRHPVGWLLLALALSLTALRRLHSI